MPVELRADSVTKWAALGRGYKEDYLRIRDSARRDGAAGAERVQALALVRGSEARVSGLLGEHSRRGARSSAARRRGNA